MTIRKKLEACDYWIAEITLLLISFIILAALLFRPDTKYTSEDILHTILLFLWNLFLIFLFLQFSLTHLKRKERLRSGLIFNALSILLWLTTMVYLIYLTFISPLLREYTPIIFSFVFISSLMVVVALYFFFKETHVSTNRSNRNS
jgi:uncharacterized membrane protein YhaH (DUF805 family)